MNNHKILVATDIPFWRRSTGAELRIATLTGFLARHSFDVQVFYISPISPEDDAQIAAAGIDIVRASSNKPPSDTIDRIRWYGDATVHQFKSWFANDRARSGSEDSGPDDNTPLRLQDFRWPWAINQFRDCVKQFNPDSILIEYIKLAYLVDGLSPEQRSSTQLLIDTHDLVYVRNQQFTERGFPHWLSVSKAEESEALKKFDSILAIQPIEAASFREMAPESATIVVGHSFDHQIKAPLRLRPSNDDFVVGYIGSANFSNSSAILNLLAAEWARTLRSKTPIRLLIAGSICRWLSQEFQHEIQSHPNVELVGIVGNLAEFYESVDLVINPVEFGTGLKIKNCEALCYGLPLLSMRNGVQTMPAECEKITTVVDSHAELVDVICQFARDRSRLDCRRNQLSNAARSLFSDVAVYTELLETLRS